MKLNSGFDSESQTLSVVIVDDAAAMRTAIREVVTSFSHLRLIAEADNGFDGLEMIRKFKPDLVTLDIRMPKMDGIRVLSALRQDGIADRVIVLSALTSEPARDKCIELGARHVFDKTLEFREFMETLSTISKVGQPALVEADA